jgi:serine/threonine protein kinase
MPEAVTHPTPQDLTAFGQGQLPARAAATVAGHLESCPACREAVAGPPPAAAAANVPPELADHPKFRVVRQLGKGGMGVIYLAEHRVLDKLVALKVLSPAVLDSSDALARFFSEAKAAGRLDHQNIARAYDIDRAGALHFLVLEFVEGRTLAQLLRQEGPLPVAKACHYVCQAALGLQHAFEQGMTHRDVKPQNLMLTPKGQVKILDFGLARMRNAGPGSPRLTQVATFMGTPAYVAPEQAVDARQADTRADIYSLGCTLYALLTGQPPFVDASTIEVVLAHVEKAPRPLHEVRADVPEALSAVVSRMLAKEPARRYQRPVEVAQALVPFARPAAGTQQVGEGARPVSSAVSTSPERERGVVLAAPRSRSELVNPTKPAPAATWARPAVLAATLAGAVALVVLGGVILTPLLTTAHADTARLEPIKVAAAGRTNKGDVVPQPQTARNSRDTSPRPGASHKEAAVSQPKSTPAKPAPTPPGGVLPVGADGKPLNLDFETGTLKDWTAEGEAFKGQPIKGDTVARRRNDMKSQHQGQYWIGGYERHGDQPQGTLTSVPFKVTHPWASFLVGGGRWPDTRVELVRADTRQVFARSSGLQDENMRRVAVDLRPLLGHEMFIRLVDKHSGGWGHLNFDDFRFHADKPNVSRSIP